MHTQNASYQYITHDEMVKNESEAYTKDSLMSKCCISHFYPLAISDQKYCQYVCVCLSVCSSIYHYRLWINIYSLSHTLHVNSLIQMYWFKGHIKHLLFHSLCWGKKPFFCQNGKKAILWIFSKNNARENLFSFHMLGHTQHTQTWDHSKKTHGSVILVKNMAVFSKNGLFNKNLCHELFFQNTDHTLHIKSFNNNVLIYGHIIFFTIPSFWGTK